MRSWCSRRARRSPARSVAARTKRSSFPPSARTAVPAHQVHPARVQQAAPLLAWAIPPPAAARTRIDWWGAVETILLAWNPKKWPWLDLPDEIRSLHEHGSLDERWGCGNRKNVPVGSRFFLIRLGAAPKGIIGSGWTTAKPYTESDSDSDRGRRREAKYVDIAFDRLHDVPPISLAVLQKKPFGSFHWITQTSGITIPAEISARLEKLWSRPANDPEHPERRRSGASTLTFSSESPTHSPGRVRSHPKAN